MGCVEWGGVGGREGGHVYMRGRLCGAGEGGGREGMIWGCVGKGGWEEGRGE